jgi:hypothetical protein
MICLDASKRIADELRSVWGEKECEEPETFSYALMFEDRCTAGKMKQGA